MKKVIIRVLAFLMLFHSGSPGSSQGQESSATLSETLDFIEHMVKTNGGIHTLTDQMKQADALSDTYKFTATTKCDGKVVNDSDFGENGQSPYIACLRTDVSTFKLSDLDPVSVKVELNSRGQDSVSVIHLYTTANKETIEWEELKRYRDGRVVTMPYGIKVMSKSVQLIVNDSKDGENGKRIVRALKHAISLCGGKVAPF